MICLVFVVNTLSRKREHISLNIQIIYIHQNPHPSGAGGFEPLSIFL